MGPIAPGGYPEHYIAPLGSFWCPWGIAGHPRPQTGAFEIFIILPPGGGPGTGMIFFSENPPQLLSVAQGTLCGCKPRLDTCPPAIFCPLDQNLQFFSPELTEKSGMRQKNRAAKHPGTA